MKKNILELIKKLRYITGVGFLECKKSLIKSKYDINLAVDNLRLSGTIKAIQKSNREVGSGIICSIIEKKCKGLLIELNCETDFVSHNSNFIKFGNKITKEILFKKLNNLESIKKHFEIEINELISKFGENIKIRRFSIIEGENIISYVHNNRIGVLIDIDKNEQELGKQLSMHIAANRPKYINVEDVPLNLIEKERKIQCNIVSKLCKNKKITEKIVNNKINKFIEELVIKKQYFIMDLNKLISQLLLENNVNINKFVRFELCESI